MAKKRLDLKDLPLIEAGQVDLSKPDILITCEEFEQGLLALEQATDIDALWLFVLTDHIRTCPKNEEHQRFFDDYCSRIEMSQSVDCE